MDEIKAQIFKQHLSNSFIDKAKIKKKYQSSQIQALIGHF